MMDKTREEILLEQIAKLQFQLAQVSERWAYCEAHGSMAAAVQNQGEATMQELLRSLATRGLTLDADGRVIPLPPQKSPSCQPN